MSLEASTLNVVVQSSGVAQTTDALNKLAVAGDKAEKSTAKLSKANKGAEASAKQQEKVWYDLLQKSAKYYEQQFNAQQRHNNKVFGLVQAEANKMNRLMDKATQQDAANFDKRRSQEQTQLEQLDVLRRNAAAKEYARAQSDANKLNTLMDRQRKQQEAAAKASAERQRVQNATYSSASLAQQIATLQKAQAYSAQGGNASARYGSVAGSASSSGELTKLQQQYRQLQTDARRANATMADTHAAVRGLSGSLGALWLTYGNLLPLIAGAGVGMALKGIVTVGADIEHTLEKIRVLAGATTTEIGQMRDMVFELGKGVQGPQDVAKAFSVLTLAGQTAEEAMTGVYATLSLATTGDVSIEKAATTLVQISTSLGYAAADFEHIGDVVAKTAAVSMSSVDSISGAFLSAAAVGEIYGASLRDIGTGLAAVANLGIQGTAAGTTLKNFYADLSKGTEKSTKALAAMGLKLRDLKDDNGAFIDIVSLVTKLNDGLSKVNGQVRTSTQDAAFGERGVKTFAALNKLVNTASKEVDQFGKVYGNRLLEISGEIERSAAFSTTAALAMAQTSTNQMKSVGNTLQVVLGKAFASIAPQIGQVARALKSAFNSPEFLSGVKTVALMVANLTVFIVEHAKQIGIMIAAYAGWKIGVFAAGLITMAKSFDIAKVAARGFSAALGPLGLAITALGVAWELYGNQKNKAITDNDANAGSLDEYAKGLKEAAAREAESLRLRRAGVSETDVLNKERIANDKATSAKLVEASADGVRAMKASLDAQYTVLNDNEKKRAEMIRKGQTQFGSRSTVAYVDNLNKYMDAYNKHLNTVKEVAASEKSLFQDRQENGKLSEANAKAAWIKPSGDGTVMSDEAVSAGKKTVNFIQNEALELNKLRAGYDAKNAAMRQSIELGKHVAAEAQQAIVMENLLAGKYGSKSENNALYQAQMRLAIAVDEAKAENEKLKKVNEFATKLAELEAAQKAYNTEAAEGSLTHFGALRKEAEGLIQVVSMSKDAAMALRDRADAADAYRKQQEAIVKLNSAADSSRSRASEAAEEAEMMLQYGENTKLGAIAVAELVIQKSKLAGVAGEVAIAALREAAATEQLNTAYRDLVKQQLDVTKELSDAQAESKLIFADSEADKVKIAAEAQKKIAAIRLQEVKTGVEAKFNSGSGTLEDLMIRENAYATYAANVQKIDEVATVKTNNLKLKDWKKTVDDIEQIGREGFYNLTEKGVGLWKSMATTFKSMFKTTVMDYIYKEFAKPIMMKVIASLAGVVGADGIQTAANAMSGGASAGGGAGTIVSAVSAVKTAYSAITGGFAGLADSVAGGVQTAMSAMGYTPLASQGLATAGGQALTPLAQGVGTAASYAGGMVAGHYAGRMISNGYSAFGGSGNTAVNTATVVGAIVGGPLGAAIGGAIGGLVNKAFGRRAKEVTSEGMRGTISDTGTTGQAYSNWKQEGGWFRSDKNGTDSKAITEDIVNTFTSGLNELKSSSNMFAKNLGVSSTALQGYSKAFDIKLTSDAEANQKAISDFFIGIGDDMATKLVPSIMDFAKQGETASGVLERLSSTFAATSNLANILGKSVTSMLGGEGLDSANARTKLVDLSGGADNLNQKASAYVAAIYTETERLAPVQKALADAFKELGVAGIDTKAQFKSLVDGLNLTNEADIVLFNNLLELAPAFAQVTDAAESAKAATEDLAKAERDLMSQRLTLEGRIAELTGDSAESARVLAAQRAIELSVMDKTLQPLQSRVWMLEDEASAAEKAQQAAEKAQEAVEAANKLMSDRLDLESQIAELTGNTVEASRVLLAQRAIELSALDNSLKPLQERVWMLQDEAKASDAAKAAADKLAESQKNALDAAIANADDAFSRLSQSIDAEKGRINASYDTAIEKAKDAADAAKEVAQTQLEAVEKQRDAIKSVVDSLRSALEGAKVDSFALTKARRQEAQAYLQVAAIQSRSGGDVTKLAGLDKALGAISQPSEEFYSTFEEYARDQAMTSNLLENILGSATSQFDYAELTIDRLDATIEAIEINSASQIAQLEQNRKDELLALDKTLELAQSQLDALKGIDNSVMSLTAAMTAFATAMSALRATQAAPSVGNAGAISGIYKDVLGRAPDAAGLDWWTNAANNGTSLVDVSKGIAGSTEASLNKMYKDVLGRAPDAAGLKFWMNAYGPTMSVAEKADWVTQAQKNDPGYKIPSFDVGTNYVPQDMLAQVHKGEMIIPASDTSDIKRAISQGSETTSMREVVAELRSLKDAIMSGDIAKVQIAKEHLRLEKKWDQEGQPEVRNVDYATA